MDKMIMFSARKQNWNCLVLITFMLYGMVFGNNEVLVNKIEVLVDDMVHIHCYTDTTIYIQWHFNSFLNYVFAGERLMHPYKERLRTEDDNAGSHILIIPRVKTEDAGWYYCSEEETGRRISSTHLTVLYSIPVCQSNMHPDGFIGPNTCNLEQENMVFSCVVLFNGTSPHLIWRLLNDSQLLNSSICEDKPNRRNCSLVLKSDPKYDGSIFICQTAASIDSVFNCSSNVIKVQYLQANRTIIETKVNDNINCIVHSNLNFNFNWKFQQDTKYATLSSNHTFFIQEPGIYQCEVEYNIRHLTCVFLVSVVIAGVKGGTILPIVLPLVGLIILFVGFVGLILFQQRRIRKQKRNLKDEKLEHAKLLKAPENENKEDLMKAMIQENKQIKYQVVSIYKDIVSEVNPMNVFDHLIKKGTVRPEEKQKVMNNVTTEERCRALIDHLFCCSKENAFITFKEALKEHYPRITERLVIIDTDDENENDYSTNELENEKIRNKIFGMYSDFMSDVEPQIVFDLLIQNRIVNIKQKQFIMKSVKKEERWRALLDHLMFCSKEKAFIILKEALKQHYPRIVERIDAFDTYNEIEFSTRFESCIIVAGFANDEGIGQDVAKIKINGTMEVCNIKPLPPSMTKEPAAAVYNNSLFVTGVGGNCDKIWTFDARSSNWEYCHSMIQGRRRHSVTFVDHVLYICGGWGVVAKTALDDIEAFDTIDDRCTNVGKLVHAVDGSGNCVPFKSSLYIFGGIDANGEPVDYVQMYDTNINSCTLLSKRMPVSRNLLRAVLWESTAILLGCHGCLIYNFDASTWQLQTQIKINAVNFGLLVHNGNLFVIGGCINTVDDGENNKWIYQDDVKSVPVANVLNNESIQWIHHAKLPKPSAVFCFGKIGFHV